MGLYNEVFCPCPNSICPGDGHTQIAQIVPGFGNIHLSDLSHLGRLTNAQLEHLNSELQEAEFKCQSCGQTFRLARPDTFREALLRKILVPEKVR